MKSLIVRKKAIKWAFVLPVIVFTLVGSGCNEKALEQVPDAGGEAVGGLSAEQASKIIAKVGDRHITLGDFARTLERMDPFDRLRYQTKERRRELLQEMIDTELLAQEAVRKGLDKRPEIDDAIRQLYRDALLSKMRDTLPPPGAITADEVKAYYEANADRFSEPERRRVSAIVVQTKADADKALAAAQKTKTSAEWGELFLKTSITAPKTRGPNDPVDLAGDLGIVGPPSDPRGANTKVPNAVRQAVFKLNAVGEIVGSVIEAEGKFFVVRLSGLTAGHKRTLQEADRNIRVAILQQKMADLEKALDTELRGKFQVTIDEKVLSQITLPKPLVDAATQAPRRPEAPAPDASASTAPQNVKP
ncbi:MAG: peptidyl-prolyl cis-trans isomerase [Polyangiaceae bacterium]|nr:peptidyl-prolyl cis-trans isomerase [Polyangiaceae bacterium]